MALIPSDVGIRLRTQADAPLTPVNPLHEIPADLPQLQAGQAFTARIQEVLPENTYRALVAGKSITLALPQGAQAGDVLELVVVDKSPRLIFARQVDSSAADQSAGGEALYPHATFSPAARLISQLLPQDGSPPAPATLNRGAPLLVPATSDSGAELAAQLAPRLAQAVSQSGVFYEAHQAQWLMGKMPTEQLQAEPQNQALPGLPRAGHKYSEGTVPFRTGTESAPTGTRIESSGPPPHGAEAATTQNALASIPEALRPLVQQQLDAAATQRLAWHGEVWPDQPMEWEIRRDPEHRAASETDAAPWTTRLSLAMPRLGQVEANLSLSGKTLNIALKAPAGAPAIELKARSGELATALEAAGISVRGIQVQHGDE